jgi:hypothetical protein
MGLLKVSFRIEFGLVFGFPLPKLDTIPTVIKTMASIPNITPRKEAKNSLKKVFICIFLILI